MALLLQLPVYRGNDLVGCRLQGFMWMLNVEQAYYRSSECFTLQIGEMMLWVGVVVSCNLSPSQADLMECPTFTNYKWIKFWILYFSVLYNMVSRIIVGLGHPVHHLEIVKARSHSYHVLYYITKPIHILGSLSPTALCFYSDRFLICL